MNAVLEVQSLVKHYPEVQAVNGLDLAIEKGTCFGLLGPNGAGKTTTVEMLEGIITPTSGSIFYKGQALDSQFRNNAGIMFQHTALQDYITVDEALTLFQNFYPNHRDREQLIESCALGNFLKQDVRNLSGGQRQRVLLAIALVNDPDVIFLDEPTTGLDPQARRNFWDLIKQIKNENKTIILTTHYMEEAYELCDEIAIMDNGKIIAQDSPRALLNKHFNNSILTLPAHEITANTELKQLMNFHSVDDRVEIISEDIHQTIQQLIQHGISLTQLQVRSRTLEDLFLELTGHGLRG